MHSVAVLLPEEIVRVLGPTPDAAAACLKELAVVELFRRAEVSSGYAAEVLGIGRWDFIQLLGRYEVSYFDQSEEELAQELEVAESNWVRPGGPPSQTADR